MVGILLSTCDGGEADVDVLESGTGAPIRLGKGSSGGSTKLFGS